MLTVLALPTIWLANRSDGGSGPRPNVAAVGLDPGSADRDDGTDGVGYIDHVDDDYDPLGDVAAYSRPSSRATAAESAAIAVGEIDYEAVGAAKATYNSNVPSGECRYNGTVSGTRITIVNVANGRSVACTTALSSRGGAALVVLSRHQFDQIADRAAAPIHVEVRR